MDTYGQRPGRCGRCAAALAMVLALVGCEHTEYVDQPLFTLHAVDIHNFGTYDFLVRVDAVCVQQGQERRCVDDIALALPEDVLAERRATVVGPPDATEHKVGGRALQLRFDRTVRLIFTSGVQVFAGDTLHVYVVTQGDRAWFAEFTVHVVDDLGLRWFLCGSNQTIACELHRESPPRPEP